ncbi:MAG: filamentous hemagglutinin, partial [Trichodesmium sp. St16_bin2-tuft]|nr:filamentous hemagglutinin [Trichodesmium sp. St16_bin2-tuft]
EGLADAGDLILSPYKEGSQLDINFSNNGFISASTKSTGDGGKISIIAPKTIEIKGDGKISVETTGAGDAGTIKIDTQNLSLQKGVSISAETNSAGKAGNIEIKSSLLTIGPDTQISATALENATNTEAAGGNISIFSNKLNISGQLGIFAKTQGEAPAGTLTLKTYNNTSDLDINFSNKGFISASTTSQGNGGNIDISAPLSIDIKGDGKISVETTGAGDAGTIKIETQNLSLQEGVSISAETNSAGKAGNIEIKSSLLTIGPDTQISATAKEGATNTEEGGGNISIFSNQVDISGKLGIFAQTQGEAPAGKLTLKTYNNTPDLDINFSNQGFISASTTSIGNGGNIEISASETIDITGDGKISVETTGAGDAGNINIKTQDLKTSDKVSITASTTGDGNAGAINIDTKTFDLTKGTSLTTETDSAGKAGDISINSETLKIGENAQLSATAKAGATNTEAGGNITINANKLEISGELGIFAETGGKSPAGNLTLNPYKNGPNLEKTGPDLNITFTEKGFISARTTSTGQGGNIEISAPEKIHITGDGKISVETEDVGQAGNITITTRSLEVKNGAQISASTYGKGDAGSVNIKATETVFIDGGNKIGLSLDKLDQPEQLNKSDLENFNFAGIISRVFSEAEGNGGNVTITTGSLEIKNGAIIGAGTSGKGNAGSLNINATDTVSIDGENSTFFTGVSSLVSPGAEGNGSNINITTRSVTAQNEAQISASTYGQGDAGNVDIRATELEVKDNAKISA